MSNNTELLLILGDTHMNTVYGYVPIKALVDELFLQLNGSV